MRNKLIAQLYKEELIPDLLREGEDVASRRQNCCEMQELLNKALHIVTEVRDFKAFPLHGTGGSGPLKGEMGAAGTAGSAGQEAKHAPVMAGATY